MMHADHRALIGLDDAQVHIISISTSSNRAFTHGSPNNNVLYKMPENIDLLATHPQQRSL